MKCIVCLLSILVGPAFAAAVEPKSDATPSWVPMRVPGTWDENATGALQKRLAGYDGFAWYRTYVAVPGSWKGKDLTLHVQHVDNAHEAYFNGVKVGGAGSFPPHYKSGLATSSDYRVPAKIVKPGQNNIVAIRVFDHDGRGGFKKTAPTLIGGKQAINMNGRWEFRTGDDLTWAKGPLALTGTAIFWRVLDASVALTYAHGGGILSPAESLKRFTVPADLEIDQVLTEPIVRQPLFLKFDERGRLWVDQFIQYPHPAGLKMVSKDRHWRAVYDKVPPPPPHHFKGADKISIHEDTDGDGVFDKHKVFVSGLSIVTSFARGRGGLFVLNPPYLLFYPDKNNDDIPDGDPTVLLAGFGLEDTHSATNSLRWGPDGWLYASQGSTVSANIIRPGLDKTPVRSMGQLIWRYHPESKRYEIFAEGGGNSYGVEFDSKGRVYSGYNGGKTRGFYYVQGGYYQKSFRKHGALSNPYSFGYFPYMKNQPLDKTGAPRFTHDFLIYEGAALPRKYRGRLFGVNPLQRRLVFSDIFPDGSTRQTRDLGYPVTSSDPAFRPVNVRTGPDGAIYIADFYEPQISHREHFSGQISKSTGRVYRLKAKDARPLQPFDLSRKSTAELVAVLRHPNKWFRQTALRLIADRRDRSIIPLLWKNIDSETGQLALESLWALNLVGGLDDAAALKTLHHANPYVRLWTVRLLGDRRQVSPPVSRVLAELAGSDRSVEVRSQLACSAKRLPARDGLPIVRNLLANKEDAADPYMPLLIWWALESKTASDRDAVLQLFRDRSVWSMPIAEQAILERLARRYAQSGTRKDLLTCARLFKLAPDAAHGKQLLKGFEQAFKGRSLAVLPDELIRAIDKLGGGSLILQVRQGKPQAVRKALKIIANRKAKPAERLEYVRTFGEVRQPRCVPVLLDLLRASRDNPLRMAALSALMSYDSPKIGEVVVGLYPAFPDDVRTAAQVLLAGRKVWSRQFLEAVDRGNISRNIVPLETVRRITFHRDKRIAALVRKHWKHLDGASTAEMQRQIVRLGGVLATGSGVPLAGRALFNKTCAKCHMLFGQGGRIGPDLTSYKRDDLRNIVANVVNPSASIREGFESYLILTEDGRTVSGFLFDQDNRVVVIRGVDGQNVTIPRDQIEEMIRQKKSLMPEGLLKNLTDKQIRDLFAYLRISQPLNY